MDISVIIVNFNTRELLRNCLLSIYKQTKNVEYEVIVSDNGSIDGSLEMLDTEFPQVIVIKNNMNIGFGAANNRAVAKSQGCYIFFLNSDTVLINNALFYFKKAAEINSNKILGAYLSNPNGNVVCSYGSFTKPIKYLVINTLYTYYPVLLKIRHNIMRKRNSDENQNMDRLVDFVTGADIFIPRNIFLAVKGFDENFFMYFEDEDLCRRCREFGVYSKIITTPKILHLEGASSKVKLNKIIIQDNSFLYYLKKYHKGIKYNFYLCMFYLSFIIKVFSFSLSILEKKKLFQTVSKYFKELG